LYYIPSHDLVLERVVVTACIYALIFIIIAFLVNVCVSELVAHDEEPFHLFVIVKHLLVFDVVRYCRHVLDLDFIYFVWKNGDLENRGRGG
jgi:hypothetical protein